MQATDRVSKIKQLIHTKKQHTNTHAQPIFWKPAKLIQRISPNKHIQQWLNTEGSLTAQLRSLDSNLEVHILSEQLERPLANESQSLNMKPCELAWIRCVLLKGGGENWIYARTIIPHFSDSNPWASVQTLGNQPLGEVLFQDKNIQRTPFTFSSQALTIWPYLNPHLSVNTRAKKGYARRSVFQQQQNALLLTEVFLPCFLNKTSRKPHG
ncbi:MAG TPA: chorismate lyase [Thiomicrorhabdus sp.]|nr:chorismate lyase [Thiomicrorhabdus sp.]